MISRIVVFLTTDIWRLRLKNLSPPKSFFIKQLRIVVLAVRGFAEDKCKFRASALTFYSLLAFVPVCAVVFGIAKGFGLQKRIEKLIYENLPGQEEIVEKVVVFANSLLENASGGFIAGIGVVFLFWTIIKVLSNIEKSFNDIWGVKTPRSIGRRFSDYISIILICPVLLVVSGSTTVFVSSQIHLIVEKISILKTIGPFVFMLLKLMPYCTVWVVFTFIFIFMPNTKVRFKSGLIGGIIAGTVFQIVQWAYINFQIGAAKYGAIYGSFAALPLFLLWLQISWLIVLFGAEVSFAHQNVDTYEFEQDCLSVSHSFKILLSLLITNLLVKNFCKCKQPLSADEISHKLEIPIRLVRQILYELVESSVLSELRGSSEKERAYQPACDAEILTVKYVIDSLEKRGNSTIPIIKSEQLDKLSGCLGEFGKAVQNSPANIPLKNI